MKTPHDRLIARIEKDGPDPGDLETGVPSPPRSKKRARHIIFILFFLFLCAVLLFIHSGVFASYVLEIMDHRLRADYGLTLESRAFKLAPLRLRLDFQGLMIRPLPAAELPLRQFTAERLILDVSPAILFNKKIHVQKLIVAGPKLLLEEEGNAEVRSRPAVPSMSRPVELRIDELEIRDGVLEYNQGTTPLELSLARVGIDIRYRKETQDHTGRFCSGAGFLQFRDQRVSLQKLELEFTFDEKAVDVSRALFASDLFSLEASGSVQDYQAIPRVQFAVRSSIHLGVVGNFLQPQRDFAGTVDLQGTLQGTAESLTGAGTLSGEGLRLAGLELESFGVKVDTDGHSATLSELKVLTLGGELRGRLKIPLSGQAESSLDLHWEDMDITRLEGMYPELAALHPVLAQGRLAASWTAPSLDALRAEGEIGFRSVPGHPANPSEKLDLNGAISFKLSQGDLEVFPSEMALGRMRLRASGRIDRNQDVDISFGVDVYELSELNKLAAGLRHVAALPELGRLERMSLAGRMVCTGRVRGRLQEPDVSFDLVGEDLRLSDLALPLLTARGVLGRRGLVVQEFLARFAAGEARASGHIGLDPYQSTVSGSSDFGFLIEDLEIGPIASLLTGAEDVAGLFSANGRMTGPLDDPDAEFHFTLSHLRVEQHRLSRIEARGRLANRALHVEEILLEKGTGRLGGSLDFSLANRDVRFDLEGRQFELEDFSSFLPEGQQAAGRLWFRLKGRGRLDRPEFELSISAEDVGFNTVRIGSIAAEIRSDGLTAVFEAQAPRLRSNLAGRLSLEKPLVLAGSLEATGLDLAAVLRSPEQPLPPSIFSELTAKINFSLPLQDWESLSAEILVDRGLFWTRGFALEAASPLKARVEKGELNLEAFHVTGPNSSLEAKGRIALASELSSAVDITGTLELVLLETIIPGSEIGGILALEGRIAGSLLNPQLRARVSLRDGSLSHYALPYRLHDLRLAAELTEKSFDLQDFFLGMDAGSLTASGRIPLAVSDTTAEPGVQGWRASSDNGITVVLRGLDLGRLTDLLPDPPEAELGGIVEGSVRAWRSGSRFDAWEAEGRLSRLDLQISRFRMGLEAPTVFTLKDRIFTLDELLLQGGSSSLSASGRFPLEASEPMGAEVALRLDSAILTPFLTNAALGGRLSLDLSLGGTAENPSFQGSGSIADGFFQLRDYPFLANDISGEFRFPEPRAVTMALQGFVNGGRAEILGDLALQNLGLSRADIKVTAEQVQLSYPEGLQAMADVTLQLSKREKQWLLSGDTVFSQSFYNADIYAVTELLNSLKNKRRALPGDILPAVRDLNLDIGISTSSPLIVDNNLAQLEMFGSARVAGNVLEPRLTGFFRNREMGSLVFGNRTYEVEQANLDFKGSDPLSGSLFIVAHTRLQHEYDELDVTLTISGTLTNLSFATSSSPPRSQLELTSLLLTGYGVEKLRTEAANVLGDQLMLYFLSPAAFPLTERIRSFLNADQVSLEPINIASEEDPGARFTFRKSLVRSLDLVYSIDVGDTQRQTWVLDYDVTRNFFLQSFAKDNGSYGGSFGHRFFLAGPRRTEFQPFSTAHKEVKIQGVVFTGEPRFPTADLMKQVKRLSPGRIFNYSDMRRSLERLIDTFKERGHINVIIAPSLAYDEQGRVAIAFDVKPMPPARVDFTGTPQRGKLRREVIDRWNGRLPEEMSLAEAKKTLLYDLNSRGYFQAAVEATITPSGDQTVYTFRVVQGPRYRIREFKLEGESAVSPKSMRKAVAGIPGTKGRGLWSLLYDFKRARLRIESLYAEAGYQSAVISPPRITAHPGSRSLDIVLPIQQGTVSRIQSLEITGNTAASAEELELTLRLREGAVHSPTLLAGDSNRLYSLYRSKGYHEVQITDLLTPVPDGPDLRLSYRIEEGPVFTISQVRIAGNQRTPGHVILRELEFKVGDTLDMETLIASQKRLYNLMAFRMVNIKWQEVPGEPKAVEILVEVQEEPRFAVSYGLRYSSEDKLEGFGQINLVNLLGRGRNALLFYKQNQRQQISRFSLKDPYLMGARISTLYSFNYTKEKEFGFVSEEIGFSIQQDLPLPWQSSLAYLFRYNRLHTYEQESVGPSPFDIVFYLPEFQTFFLRDTRTSRLNAKQGSFSSLSLTYSPEFLKTDHHYFSFFLQQSIYQPLHPRIVWASSYRVGLASAFGAMLIWPRRFFAGGSNSIRGFDRDMVGPYDPFLQRPEGGEGLFVMNQELRFVINRWLEGVGFVDLGNVYAGLRDFDPFDVRVGAGFGMRLNTPIAFFRFDYGFNLKPRGTEPGSVFYFSIGQAF
ncbi:MAG: translocation/assembly module TamB domain-containing protein [Candidatus Aminicenantaceae bacterium]